MKKSIIYLSFLFFIAFSSSAFASVSANKDGADADPGKPAESHFTLPIGFPVSLNSHDSSLINSKKDTSRNVIKGQTLARKKIYQVSIDNDNSVSGWRQTEEAFRQAEDMNADYILIHVDDDNAYSTASKIRDRLYHYKTPVLLYVENKNKNNNSIIPLTADTLAQLRSQANAGSHYINSPYENSSRGIGNKKEVMAILKQPYILSLGKKCERVQDLYYEGGLSNSTPSVTKTLSDAGINNVDIINYKPTPIGKLVDDLSGSFFSMILMLLILVGIYFELRSIAKGLAMFVSVCASLLLFASHYFEGDQDGWYALLFFLGVLLLCRDVYYSTRGLYSALAGFLFIFSAFVLCLAGSEGILLSLLLVSVTAFSAMLLCIRIERRLLNLKFISEKTVQDVSLAVDFTNGTFSPTS